LVVACGFEEGVMRVEATVERLDLPLRIVVCDMLDEAARCFSEASPVFSDSEERLTAERMVKELGDAIGSDEPLGTGNCQALVVFEHNCPNNSLPVLWKEGSEFLWRPLFPRRTTS
jgi:hypothetical protein